MESAHAGIEAGTFFYQTSLRVLFWTFKHVSARAVEDLLMRMALYDENVRAFLVTHSELLTDGWNVSTRSGWCNDDARPSTSQSDDAQWLASMGLTASVLDAAEAPVRPQRPQPVIAPQPQRAIDVRQWLTCVDAGQMRSSHTGGARAMRQRAVYPARHVAPFPVPHGNPPFVVTQLVSR